MIPVLCWGQFLRKNLHLQDTRWDAIPSIAGNPELLQVPPVWSKKVSRQQTCEHELHRNAPGGVFIKFVSMLTLGDFPVYLQSICSCIFKCSFIITSDSTLCARLLQSNEFSSNIDRRELLTCKSQGRRAYPRSSAIIKKGLAKHSSCVGTQYQLYIHAICLPETTVLLSRIRLHLVSHIPSKWMIQMTQTTDITSFAK